MSGPRFTQLVLSRIDELGLTLEERGVFVDLLMRVDPRTLRYSTTLTDYGEFLNTNWRRIKKLIDRLVELELVHASFAQGHDGAVEIPVEVYESCVRSPSQYRAKTAAIPRQNRDKTAESRERPGKTSTDNQIDRYVDQIDARDRLNEIRDLWRAATGKSVNDDQISRCLTACRTDCVSLGADYTLIIDETIGRFKERIEREPRSVNDFCGYFRISVRENAQERLGA